MRRAWVPLILWAASLIGALATGRSLYVNLTYLFTLILVGSVLWAWSGLGGLRLARRTRTPRAQVGQPMEEHFRLTNTSALPKLWVEARDQSELPGHYASQVISNIGAGHQRSWIVRTLCTQRGRFRLGPVVLRSSDPLGLFEFRRRFPQTNHVVIYPAVVPISNFPQPTGFLPGGDALRRRTHYVTTNASGVRDYVPGDSFNRIHWPSSARRDHLIVKEFELDPLSDVWIMLDMNRLVHARKHLTDEKQDGPNQSQMFWSRADPVLKIEPSTEEYVVTIAASLTGYFIRNDRAVGLVSHGQHRELIQPERGERQSSKILETLAVLQANGEMPFEEVLRAESRRLNRGTTVVAISPSPDPGWAYAALYLSRAGLHVITVVIDSFSFGGAAGGDSLHAQLLAAGATSVLVKCDDNLEQALNARASSRPFSAYHARR